MSNPVKKAKGILLIRKSNQLIESRFKFDTPEMRIFLSLISQIKREDENFNVYRIWYRDVAELFGMNKQRGYEDLRQAVKSLMQKSFFVRYSDNGKPREVQYHILRKIDYSLLDGQDAESENQDFVDVRIEEDMKPFLLQLQKSFTSYDIRNVASLGGYSVRVYELLKQYETIGHRTLKFEEMKMMFELENEYPRFSTFYQRVLEPSIKEINEFTDLVITEVKKIKTGKKITGVYFKFTQKTKNDILLVDSMVEEPAAESISVQPQRDSSSDERFTFLYSKVVESFGITPSVLMGLIASYSDEQFEQAIRVTHRAKIDGQVKTSVSGFFIQALKKGFTDLKEERLKKDKREEEQKRVEAQIQTLEMEKERKIFERLKILTQEDETLTLEAIENVRNTEGGKFLVQQEEINLNRPLDIEDFRIIKDLRFMVIDTLITNNLEKFSDIILPYDSKINELRKDDLF
jgi:plasmid replication initiation protein